ncbi:DUF3168 domain-containing protein [Haematobacter genomosp. 1]|uniref:DUF3168 domain-containing protein n=1 Tax=Haematobacter genomosp. 1 TaxID=366618 RepID=A0A212AC14_9RHOB|nr:DUF3168 domain-containing protein [Haematobacter genomosp. 1]OWJ78418.1 hypothetical protein CDV49_08255 [Haematobacter genomosp. 1]
MPGLSNALQTLILQRLTTFAPLVSLGVRVCDPPRAKEVPPYISFGPSDWQEDDADCIDGRVETIQIDVWSSAQDGQREAKDICEAVKKALHGYDADLGAHALVGMRVPMVRVFRDPDGITTHGVVQVEALIEEND